MKVPILKQSSYLSHHTIGFLLMNLLQLRDYLAEQVGRYRSSENHRRNGSRCDGLFAVRTLCTM